MAFTLGFHIILASVGVAFPAIMLIANYRGLRRDDAGRAAARAALVEGGGGDVRGRRRDRAPCSRSSSGCCGRSSPAASARSSACCSRSRGSASSSRRSSSRSTSSAGSGSPPWTHFWAGVPIVFTGLGGAFSVVAVNSWMNQPQGFSPTTGDVTHVEPLKVIFNPAVPYEVPHMILAAYLVTGFLVASVYAVGMLRGRRDRYHRLGLLIPLTVACIATPIQFAVGDTAARAIAKDQPIKFAAMECVQTTSTHVTEYIFGRCTAERREGRDRHPRLRLVPGRLEHRHAGDRPRHRAARRPPAGEHDAALGVRHDGRDLHAADRASGCGSRSAGGASATSRRRSGSCARSRSPASRPWWRSSAAGS